MSRKRKKRSIASFFPGAATDYDQIPEQNTPKDAPKEDISSKALLDIVVQKHYKVHILVFLVLSALFFVFAPVDYIPLLLAGVICTVVFLHLKHIRFTFEKWHEIAVFAVANLWLTLAFFGLDIFIANSLQLGPSQGFVYFTFCFIWTCYVLQSALDAFKWLGNRKVNLSPVNTPVENYWRKWLLLFAIMFAVFMVWQRAYNPIVISPDSWEYIDGWRIGTYYAHRSPVYSFLVYLVLSFAPTRPELQWVAFAQITAFSSLLATILMYFHIKRIRFIYLIPFAVILPLIPSFGQHTIVIWIDLTTGIAVLWLTYVLIRILDEVIINDTASNKQLLSFCLQLCLSLTLAYFIRPNTILVFIVMAPLLMLVFFFRKKWKLLASVCLSIALVLLIRYPGYTALMPQTTSTHEMMRMPPPEQVRYWAGIHDMQFTYYSGGSFSEKTYTKLRKHLPRLHDQTTIDNFSPYIIRGEGFGAVDLHELTIREFLTMYIDTFFRNPLLMLRSMLARNLQLWVISPRSPVSNINYIYIFDLPSWTTDFQAPSAPSLGVFRQHNFLTDLMDKYNNLMLLPVLSTFFWRIGFWASLLVVSMMALIIRKKYLYLFTFLPAFVYLGTLYLANGWPDFRYGLPGLFVGMFLPPLAILLKGKQ